MRRTFKVRRTFTSWPRSDETLPHDEPFAELLRIGERGGEYSLALHVFMRCVSLPMPVNADQAEAIHEYGVQTLHLPKAETVKPKRLEVRKTVSNN